MFTEIIKESYIDAYLDYFKKDKKSFRITRLIYGFVLFFIFAVGFLIMQKPLWLLLTPLAFYVGYKLPYFSLISLKKNEELRTSFLFPQFLQSFMGLLSSSGNIYQTLKATIPYTGEPLKRELEKLVKNIEKDNHRDYYIAFAEFVGTNEAYTIMDMIYQFSEYGVKKDTLHDLRDYIQGLDENKVNELIERKMMSGEKYGYMSIFISLFLLLGYAGAILFYYLGDIMDALKVVM
ncbi:MULTISPECIES: flagellar assembly protein FlaJ [Siminovitchia]|uniref:Flagellar assembly protein FlaJ n=1 Tax=Siminovitchia sediminis TaxID=1274353 RepID=A0ABW4KEM4_9BACI|nr:flagellar assembly protein FlaJ [Siminovitchia fortis]